MKLYNSLTRKIEEFTPLEPGKAGIYSCGPTVYNNLHIGNLSAFIYADVLRRSLTVNGFTATHVMNITDVDDKTIRDSKAAYPDEDPLAALQKLTKKYTDVFKSDLAATGCDLDSIQFISAVDTIDDMITLIQRIIDAGFAYAAEDGIYFSIAHYASAGHEYGLLQKVDTASSKARVANDEYDKDAASDFALWKRAEEGEPSWKASFTIDEESVAMPGRPGWHIECSAMSEKLLGVPFDIHTGGVDLKFPHHENEIAQTCAAGAEHLANYFVHNNHILVDGKKMSKSLGNFYTLRDIEEKGYNPQDFRMLVLESHYRSESNFSCEILEAARNRMKSWRSSADLLWQLPEQRHNVDNIQSIISNALMKDLDTPKALSDLSLYFAIFEKELTSSPARADIAYIESALGLQILGEDISPAQKKLLEERSKARNERNWEESDRIRDELDHQGIGINDGPRGQIWYRL